MKFAHFADIHIGSWRDPKLSEASTQAFVKAADACLEQAADFILISGDFFNTSLPSIDCLKEVAKKLKQIHDSNTPVYVIAGSHDFSPTGKTMLDVLENAGLIRNVMRGNVTDNRLKLKFTVDSKTGTKITGIIGKKGMLERKYFEALEKENLEAETGTKIFMFHTAISEFKPEGLESMESTPISDFPKGFDYYAGGHVHHPYLKQTEGYGTIANPGPLFPNSFREIEKLGCGGFYMVQGEKGRLKAEFQPIQVHNTFSITTDCTNKTPQEAEEEITNQTADKEFNNTIVTIRLHGKLRAGKPTDIDFRKISETLYQKSAHFVMKNTAALSSNEFEEIKITTKSIEETENLIIKEHLSKIKIDGMSAEEEFELVKNLMSTLNKEKDEGETTTTFERRVKEDAEKTLKIKL